jgi:hypothetical protein
MPSFPLSRTSEVRISLSQRQKGKEKRGGLKREKKEQNAFKKKANRIDLGRSLRKKVGSFARST